MSNLVLEREFIHLGETLRAHAEASPVYYLANPGNWGDALIRAGTITFLSRLGISYQELRVSTSDWIVSTPPIGGGLLIYGGGGAWCSLWNHSPAILRQTGSRFRHTIVLPSSYETSYELPNTTFFARDRFESVSAMDRAIFCHDMAFCLDVEPGGGSGTGYFFRTDDESGGLVSAPEQNRDLSAGGDHTSDVEPFLAAVDEFRTVHTDRLHVAIAGCLLEKTVHLYAGSYFKNRAV
ncbi:MAG: hypothetical protein ACE5EV_04250, partial [Gaiellales bacterium]